ncbi:MAG: HAMP domain-containing protein [Nitrospiraceae bacterium]|nr:MAG: HAMP domain-containing protein [Nitrospiraceae bacterium]
MLKKLGKSITIANALAFIVVIMVGGVSIFLSQMILHNQYKISEISRDIVTIDNIHSDTYQLILSMHHFFIDPDEIYSTDVRELTEKLERTVTNYRKYEVTESSNGNNPEVQHLDTMLYDIEGLKGIGDMLDKYVDTGQLDSKQLNRMEMYGYEIEELAAKINAIHFQKIENSISKSLSIMRIILFIYLVFITLGGLTIYAGHLALLKKVVNPIKALASATIDFAEGKMDVRVNTDSKSEIGQLYNSFNQMADKLQENDEILRKFNEALERKVRERTIELQQANEKLQRTQVALIRTEKEAAVGQIAAGVTHEVKNPLNSLSISTQMLLKELADKFGQDSSAYESASLIRHEINRINNILEAFVKFAKFPEPQFYKNNINTVITEVAALVSSGTRDNNIQIELQLTDDMPDFNFDARQFKEVLINLIQNALKSMNGKGLIEIKTDTVSDNVIISVKDSGAGIPEKYREKIFNPFFSTREEGLGLGLPIVQRIIESHGGKIKCTSIDGKGTEFVISIPVERG